MNLRTLSPRERNLALLLGATAFLLLNLLFLPKLGAWNRVARQKHTELKGELAAAQGWTARQSYWGERRKWLEDNEPELTGPRRDSATQLEEIQAAARKYGLTLSDIQLLQLKPNEYFHPVGARITLHGPWKGLVDFMADLQNPELFHVVPRFNVKSDQEPPNVRCELEIQRWFHKAPDDE